MLIIPKAKVFGGLLATAAVIKITGHATWDISALIRNFEDSNLSSLLDTNKLVFDLTECSFLDSTVVGLMSHLAAGYLRKKEKQPLLVYASDKIRQIIETINGTFLFDMKTTAESGFSYDASEIREVRTEKIAGMDEIKDNILLAHETLQQISPDNAREFSPVVESLKKPPQS